eukprot:scaffold5535_cov180-Amphora_coffeaeformis.AAC.16
MRVPAFFQAYLVTMSRRQTVEDNTPTTATTHFPLASAAKNYKYDPIMDWTPPPPNDIRQTRERILTPMKAFTSAVFYCTDSNGGHHEGLVHVPRPNGQRPVLFVSNHQLVGLDSWLVVNELLEQCGIFTRALTHPFLYPSSDNPDGTTFLETYGCLPVSTRNFYRLLQTNQPILLFPGGAKEAFVNKASEAYALEAWSADKTDFVRAAAKFNATIVPFSSVGAAESAFFLQDLLGDTTMQPVQSLLQTAAGPRAPIDARYDSGPNNRISFPLVVPKLVPSRHYFLFGKPFELEHLDYRDREACQMIYLDIKRTIQDGCRALLQASQQDPFYDPLRRVPYEQLWRRQAPSFLAKLLDA